MTILSKPLRRQLETTIKQAREIAEEAAKEAIARMRVAEAEAAAHLSDNNKALRRRLRAHARTLGDTRDAAGAMTTARLQDAASYEIWHRMLFGRFLAERGLLVHPELGATMSVAELRDLAKEEGAADEWALAERYAAPGLPGVFKPDDPVLALPIAPEFSKRLRAALSGLPEEVFTADDSLGWTYQFWRASEKDAVNAAGGKIGAVELPAVTQLFTEPYMVKFLLHNTLGAWWAGKVLARDPDLARDAVDEDVLREACAIAGVTWDFLRFVRDDDGKGPWRPASGIFPGWPSRAAEITYCDPCCGSGHFLVEAFAILAALRQCDEGLSAADAAISVLKDNLHGLEIDGRCVQIATFNVALSVWKLTVQPIALPPPHIAWVGAPPPMSRTELATLAGGDASLRRALEMLHDQFVQAPLIGSLMEVGARDLLDSDLRERGSAALEKLRSAEPERAEGAIAARGLLDASTLLAQQYVLVATNVPFLGRGKQETDLSNYIAARFPVSKADLATTMFNRFRRLTYKSGTIGVVLPQNWLFLSGYESFRNEIVSNAEFRVIAPLGVGAFESISGAVVNVVLFIINNNNPEISNQFAGLDTNGAIEAIEKSSFLSDQTPPLFRQISQRNNPDTRIILEDRISSKLLGDYAVASHGSFDAPRFSASFWEIADPANIWVLQQSTPAKTEDFAGNHYVFRWEGGVGSLARMMEEKRAEGYTSGKWKAGVSEWSQSGILCGQMHDLPSTLYMGRSFDENASVIIPKKVEYLPAILSYCRSDEFRNELRKIDQSIKITCKSLVKVPFDLEKWNQEAATSYPNGIPKPYSDDPTQWLFHGHPAFAEAGLELHVALARLVGYRWPAESDSTLQLSDLANDRIASAGALPAADPDGFLPLQASGRTLCLADRLRALLANAYGASLLPSQEQALVRSSDVRLDRKEARDVALESWLTDRAFRQHCILFQQRPFLWQIWDGMRNGFSAFLNYHRLDRAALEKLTYTLLGDWIRTAKAEGNTARLERGEQLQQKLARIIEGESPYDIFVRWKPLAKQPLGWDPDLDDGVRLNIRPFMTAGILREEPKGISWKKDRGTDTPSSPWYDLGPQYGGKQGDRVNDHHTTLAKKLAARGMS